MSEPISKLRRDIDEIIRKPSHRTNRKETLNSPQLSEKVEKRIQMSQLKDPLEETPNLQQLPPLEIYTQSGELVATANYNREKKEWDIILNSENWPTQPDQKQEEERLQELKHLEKMARDKQKSEKTQENSEMEMS